MSKRISRRNSRSKRVKSKSLRRKSLRKRYLKRKRTLRLLRGGCSESGRSSIEEYVCCDKDGKKDTGKKPFTDAEIVQMKAAGSGGFNYVNPKSTQTATAGWNETLPNWVLASKCKSKHQDLYMDRLKLPSVNVNQQFNPASTTYINGHAHTIPNWKQILNVKHTPTEDLINLSNGDRRVIHSLRN